MSDKASDITYGVKFDPATARDITYPRSINGSGTMYMLNLIYFANREQYSRKYNDMVDILVRLGGQLKLIFAIFAIILTEFNEDSYLHLVYKYALNIKK